MVRLTFYGGVNEIGGNKVLLEDGERRLFLDFGFPYKAHKRFYNEYLKPRGGAGLLDPLTMGLLPPVEGIYRSDMEMDKLWEPFRQHPLYRRLDSVDGVLLTHAHLDHSGHISFLSSEVPVFSTAATAFIAKALQDSGKSDFDQQVCYFSPTAQACPTGWKQSALLSSGDAKQQRRFCIADVQPESLSAEAARFWTSGFWEKSARQKELASCPLSGHDGGRFTLRCFPVDHSIPGACAWGIETSAGWVVYSGDLRFHGKRAGLTRSFVKEAARLKPRALVLEGTNVRREKNTSESDVYENARKAIAGSRGLVIADFSARDLDRLVTFRNIARDTGRKLVILPRDAYMLKTLHLLEPDMPDVASDDGLLIYQETTASRNPAFWLRNIFQEYESKVVLAGDVSREQEQYILCFSFFDLNELPSLRPRPGGLYVFSSSEPHDEEQEIDFRRLHEWLKHFGLSSFGLPVETSGGWQIPEVERGIHASGHACGPDLFEIAREISPEVLLPVHSDYPGIYTERLRDSRMKVVQPAPGGSIEL